MHIPNIAHSVSAWTNFCQVLPMLPAGRTYFHLSYSLCIYCTTSELRPCRDSVINTSAALFLQGTLCGGHQLVMALNSSARSSLRASSSAGDVWPHKCTNTWETKHHKGLQQVTNPSWEKLYSIHHSTSLPCTSYFGCFWILFPFQISQTSQTWNSASNRLDVQQYTSRWRQSATLFYDSRSQPLTCTKTFCRRTLLSMAVNSQPASKISGFSTSGRSKKR